MGTQNPVCPPVFLDNRRFYIVNSDKIKQFNPFESRACRTVRNTLGQSLLAAIPAGEMEPVSRVAHEYAPADADEVIKGYVNKRAASYRAVFAGIRSAGIQAGDTWYIALLLWNQGLFFECHEWLEKKWCRSEGAEKKMIQAVIWSAGAYSHLEYGRTAAAGKLAARAIVGLKHYREQVPDLFDVDVLVSKLGVLDPVPPKFSLGRHLSIFSFR